MPQPPKIEITLLSVDDLIARRKAEEARTDEALDAAKSALAPVVEEAERKLVEIEEAIQEAAPVLAKVDEANIERYRTHNSWTVRDTMSAAVHAREALRSAMGEYPSQMRRAIKRVSDLTPFAVSMNHPDQIRATVKNVSAADLRDKLNVLVSRVDMLAASVERHS